MRRLEGHDDHENRDYVLWVHDDGTHELATRPGNRDTWTTWSAPVALTPAEVTA